MLPNAWEGLVPLCRLSVLLQHLSDIYLLCQSLQPSEDSKLGPAPVGMIGTENSGNWESHKVYLYQQLGRNAHVSVSGTVRNGNKCKNMLFWQVIIFNTKTESTSQLCFAFFRDCGWFSFLASWFLLKRNLFISHPLHTPSPKLKYLSTIILLSA